MARQLDSTLVSDCCGGSQAAQKCNRSFATARQQLTLSNPAIFLFSEKNSAGDSVGEAQKDENIPKFLQRKDALAGLLIDLTQYGMHRTTGATHISRDAKGQNEGGAKSRIQTSGKDIFWGKTGLCPHRPLESAAHRPQSKIDKPSNVDELRTFKEKIGHNSLCFRTGSFFPAGRANFPPFEAAPPFSLVPAIGVTLLGRPPTSPCLQKRFGDCSDT